MAVKTSSSSQRVIVLEPTRLSPWGSCLTIIPNLSQSYRDTFGEQLTVLDYGMHQTNFEVFKCAERIAELEPSHLVFVDHLKHPLTLLTALDQIYGSKKWPHLIFHVFGDFTLYTPEWLRSEPFLKNKRVQFVCASPRQRKLVSSFVTRGKELTSVCPFPVSEKDYAFEPGLRARERQARGLSDETFVMTYTGRLSLQKNILLMIQNVAASMEPSSDWRLLLAGSFDDLGSPFFGIRLPSGSYYRAFEKLMKELPENLRSRIEWLGPLDKSELRSLYHATDLFISFSTHHDEDYGMSPVEALCCGTPALISDWGGFEGFAVDLSVKLVPVKLSGLGPQVDPRNLALQLIEFKTQSAGENELTRSARSKKYLDHFGILRASTIVATHFTPRRGQPRFSGFNAVLRRHARLNRSVAKEGRLFKMGPQTDPNYFKVYRNYISQQEHRS